MQFPGCALKGEERGLRWLSGRNVDALAGAAAAVLAHKVEALCRERRTEEGRSLGLQPFHSTIPALDLHRGLSCERETKALL